MNAEHGEELIAYATHYGDCDSPTKVVMKNISPDCMELDVDGKTIKITFPQTLSNSGDVHKALVSMSKGLPKSP